MSDKTAQDLRKDKTDAEQAITAILRNLEEKYPGFEIKKLQSWRQTLTGPHYLKINASIEIEIFNL